MIEYFQGSDFNRIWDWITLKNAKQQKETPVIYKIFYGGEKNHTLLCGSALKNIHYNTVNSGHQFKQISSYLQTVKYQKNQLKQVRVCFCGRGKRGHVGKRRLDTQFFLTVELGDSLNWASATLGNTDLKEWCYQCSPKSTPLREEASWAAVGTLQCIYGDHEHRLWAERYIPSPQYVLSPCAQWPEEAGWVSSLKEYIGAEGSGVPVMPTPWKAEAGGCEVQAQAGQLTRTCLKIIEITCKTPLESF